MNRQWRIARYPRTDEVIGPAHFAWAERAVPAPGEGEFLVRTLCLAPGPAQRGYLSPGHSNFYGTVPVGEVMRGRGVGEVVVSRHPDYVPGDIFIGSLGWQDYSVQRPRGAEFVFSNRKITTPLRPLPTTTLGMLGQSGTTAWFGLLEAGGLGRATRCWCRLLPAASVRWPGRLHGSRVPPSRWASPAPPPNASGCAGSSVLMRRSTITLRTCRPRLRRVVSGWNRRVLR